MDVMVETPRLTLRLPRMGDAERLTGLLNNYAVAANLARVPHPYRISDARAWLRTRRPGLPAAETSFAIDLEGEGFVGQVGFHRGTQGSILGYWLGEPYWGRGIMSEAARAAVAWFFEETAVSTLHSGVFYFNLASLAVQKKLGFVETGTSFLLCLARGEEVRHIDTELTRSAWAALRS